MSTITLNDVSALVTALADAEDEVAQAEQLLKDKKEAARFLKEESIPSAMQSLGLKQVVLETGEKVTIAQEVYASIPAENKAEAYAWLEDNGFGGLLKLSLAIEYGKGEKQEAIALFKELTERGIVPDLSEGVHAQTMKAFLKEQIAAGNEALPLDLFGARPVFVAKITQPKSKG
jgi:tagatose-1,6-bisphosphate aldolase